MTDKKPTTSYKEVQIGNTLYRVTSVFTGEKDLGKTLEQLAIRHAMAEITSCNTENQTAGRILAQHSSLV